jgi:tRNA pseudouridine38-40 synthase
VRYFLHLSYNGSLFYGWQKQIDDISVQQTIEKALFYFLKEGEKDIVGCGRTDSGVNALNYYAHFDARELSNEEIEHLIFRLNNYFNYSINIINIYRMQPSSHARFDAISRTYKYFISTKKQPFFNEFSYYFPHTLNIENMNLACEKLFQYSDFTSFSKLHTQVNNNNCNVMYAHWDASKEDNGIIVFTIKANRFLRNMVRAIVGTMLLVGQEKISVEDFCRIIEKKDRQLSGTSVMAKALFLYDIEYPKNIFLP